MIFKKNFVIDVEGIDCSGKDTLIDKIKKSCEEKKINNVGFFRFPCSIYEKEIRELLSTETDNKQERININNQLVWLFLNNFSSHSDLIKKYDVSIINRYIGSFFSHQGLNFDYKYLKNKMNNFDKIIIPDIILFLDISVEEAYKRLENSNRDKKYLFFEKTNYMKQIKNKYEEYFKTTDIPVFRLNAEQDKNKIYDDFKYFFKDKVNISL